MAKNKGEFQANHISFLDSSTMCRDCGWDLGWKSHGGELYFLKCYVGRGAYGSVYKACKKTPNGFEEKYALKFLQLRSSSLEDGMRELEREVRALQNASTAGARVPNYIDCYSPSIENRQNQHNNFFLVQEFIEGENLQTVFESKKKYITEGNTYFQEQEIFQELIDLLETLHLLHKQNIMHRDIKPLNIIRKKFSNDIKKQEEQEKNQLLYLVDFGSSKQLQPIENNFFTKNYPSTILYKPPEVYQHGDVTAGDVTDEKWEKYQWLMRDFKSDKSLDTHCWTRDIYSLGITIFDILIGIPQGNSSVTPRWKPSDKAWSDWMLSIRQKVPNLYPILEKMTRFYPDERYQTAMDVLLETSTQAWYVYGDREDKNWLLKEKLLNNLLDDKTRQEINTLPQQQQMFVKESQDEIERQKEEIKRQKIEQYSQRKKIKHR
ncbi:MAG: protein kinase [Symploca sp. SIO2G7]|nr:protein kinase [Symploca sp. SIO2G7]